ncbi:MAG: AMP-binding protein [Clostridiales bacterium 43-6]|nr:MAG: AMP-binding protein [Clostridiales bacterium 43-6]
MKDQSLWEITIGAQMDKMANEFGGQEAIKYTDRDYRRTWKEFNDECDRVAKGFLSLGVKKGDHIAVWATNVPEWIITFFAAIKIGAVLVTVNTSYKIVELEYLLHQSDSKVLVMIEGFKENNYVETIHHLCPELKTSDPYNLNLEKLPRLKNIFYAGEDTPDGMLNFKVLEEMGKCISDEEYKALTNSLHCDEVINMQYTSGTTGFPKGVMLTHKNILNNGRYIGDNMKFTEKDKLCITVPFFHCFGMVLAIMACITHGTSMVPIEYYSPVKVMAALQDEECTAVHGVPTMFIAMLEHKNFADYRFSKLRTGIMAGSPCPIKTMRDVVDKMGMQDITIVFGQTEASPGCTMTSVDDALELRVSTVGRDLPGCENKIIDIVTGETLGPHQPGEFCTRGYHIMKGYYNMPDATALAIDGDGWLHTGDIATVDENGYYKITGRLKDMIIRGGENIYPKEIEDFLYHHPNIKDVQVIGVPSKQYGEEIMACVILREGAALTEGEVKAYVKENMARHKTPSFVRFMTEFPLTASGKIQKFKLRQQAIEQLNLKEASEIETA